MGGLERVALDLASGQTRLGHEVLTVSLAASGGGPLAAEFRDAGLEIEMLPVRSKGFDTSVPFKLGSLFRERRVDIVHTHNPQPLIMSAVPGRTAGAVLIHTKHGVNPDTWKRMLIRRTAARLVHRFVAVSDATARVALEQRECRPSQLLTIPNGIDVSRFAPSAADRRATRLELGLDDDDFFVLTVGRLWPEKGHEFLVRALVPILADSSDGPRTHLAIAGDGPERANLDHLIDDLGLAHRVRLLGNRRDVPNLVAAADTFVLSSVREGLPLVIPEAMAGGLAVVSTAVGGIPKVVIDDDTGFLVKSGDSAAMLERITALRDDAELRERLGASGRSRALKSYSCERMVEDYVNLYWEAYR